MWTSALRMTPFVLKFLLGIITRRKGNFVGGKMFPNSEGNK